MERFSLDIADVIAEHVQASRRGHGGVEVAKRPRGGVARVFQRLGGGLIVGIEHGQLHDALALHLHAPLVRDRQRHAADRADLRQDRLAGNAVAARRALHQYAVVIGEVHGQPVELVFEAERDLARACGLLHTLDKVAHALDGAHLVEAPQRGKMDVRIEFRQRRAADAQGRAVRRDLAACLFER